MRFVGERKAAAAAVLAFFSTLFLLNGLLGPPPLMPMFLGMAAVYITGFVGVVAGWFWARWYSMGLGFSGIATAILLAWQIGIDTIVIIYGATHLAVLLSLVGQGPASAFDGRKDWREKYRMDDNAANRLGKSIMRVGASLPYLVLAGLAPKQGMGLALGLGAVALGAWGLRGLVKTRTWGLLALAGAAGLLVASRGGIQIAWTTTSLAGVLAIAGLAAAMIPFARPMARALLRD